MFCLFHRYLHITDPEAASAGLSRRGSAPVVHTPWVGHALPERRGSEPSLLQAQGFYSQGRRGSESMQTYVAHLQHNFGRQNTDITEEDVAEGSSQTSPQRQSMTSIGPVSYVLTWHRGELLTCFLICLSSLANSNVCRYNDRRG